MKILLAQNMFYVPAHGGAAKANRLLLEGLAARGHECRAVATISGGNGRRTLAQFHEELTARGIVVDQVNSDSVVFQHQGVQVHAGTQMPQLGQLIDEVSRSFKPDVVLVPSDEPGMVTVSVALEANPGRVIYLAHTMQHLPFGKRSFFSNAAGTELLRRCAGIITVSRAIEQEIARETGLPSAVIPFPVYGPGPFPDLHNFEQGAITLINPCAYKGLPIFSALAEAMPDLPFAAVPTWGTTPDDRVTLARLPNVRILEPSDNIDDIFAQTRVLLVPSLWDETFGLVAVEAMLRGIPVLASDVGGLAEAKLGVDYVLPVAPIRQYQVQVDQHLQPVPIVPEQDIAPWENTLRTLLSDRTTYERVAGESRAAAHAFVEHIRIEPFEAYFKQQISAAQATPSPEPSGVRNRIDQLSPERQALLARMLKQKNVATPPPRLEIPKLPRNGEVQEFECSSGQKRLWLIQHLDPEGSAYNSVMGYRVAGAFDLAVFERSLALLVRRHESLRTTFVERDGQPFQRINQPWQPRVAVYDLRSLPANEREAEAERIAERENSRPYRLETGPLLRAVLIRLSDDQAICMFGLHHIISDGWSMGTFQRELSELYNAQRANRAPSLPELELQCADISVWQNQQMRSDAMDKHISYWLEKLADPLPSLELPTDHPQPSFMTQSGAFQLHTIPVALVEAIGKLSRKQGATPFMTFLTLFKILLLRYSGQEDLVLGTVIANRTHAALEPQIAFLANTLILRTNLSGNPNFCEALARVRDTASGAYQHQDLLFALLVEKLNPTRDLNRNPLFDATFGYHNVPPQPFLLDGMQVEGWRVPNHVCSMPLSFDMLMAPDGGVQVQIEYSTELFEHATIERLFHHYVELIKGVLANPDCRIGDLPLLTPSEREHILGSWANSSSQQDTPSTVVELFAAQATVQPNAIAVIAGHDQLSYGQLEAQANRLAHMLVRRGIGPEQRVAICLRRTPALVVAVLAVLKAGGAYLPLDPDHAPERLAFLTSDAEATLVLAEQSTVQALSQATTPIIVLDQLAAELAAEPIEALSNSVAPENAAYVLYTSGSTGTPKGVIVTHANLANAYAAWEQVLRLRETTSAHLQMANATFDVFTGDLVRALCSGKRLVLCPRELLLDAPALFQLINRERIDCAEFVPVVMRELLQYLNTSNQRLEGMRVVLVGSDSWFIGESRALRERCGPTTRLFNTYGLTEATIDSTYCEVTSIRGADGQMVPIGRPFPGSQVYVLDQNMQPVPAIIAGELYIGGRGVARGYLNRPDLTAERFVRDPFSSEPHARFYRTGDLARFRPDGTLELIGRADQQVKIRGYRIELGEIETCLRQHPALQEAVVVDRDDQRGEKQLVAYIVAATPPSTSELRAFLRARLPDYMLPAAWVQLNALPISANGKIDRRALPAPDLQRLEAGESYVAPRSEAEEAIVEIWHSLIEIERIGVFDNFFELGGHSLLATRLVARLREAFEIDMSLRTVFEYTTPAEQAEATEALLLAEIARMDEDEAERLVTAI